MTKQCFSQFFVLSSRGDKIITRKYRFDIVDTEDIFFRKVKFFKGNNIKSDAPPIFNVEGINFLYVKKNGLYFVLVSRFNISPTLGLEFLLRICTLLKDYCGVLNEESLKKNFTLVNEILDEVIDYGYIQSTSTTGLKYYIFNDPVEESSGLSIPFSLSERKTITSAAARRSILSKKNNEIFVDILEKINVVFNAQGNILNSEIIGSIVMKSFLTGSPRLRLGLNEDLSIGKKLGGKNYGGGYSSNSITLDKINFSDFVQVSEFENSRILSLYPPDGEFSIMHYRITGEHNMPFRVLPYVSQKSDYKIECIVKIRANVPKKSHGSNVLVRIPVPKTTSNVAVDFGVGSTTTYEYKASEKMIIWGIKKFNGGSEQVIRLKIALESPITYDPKKQIGPISMKFEIPMHNVSGLQVRFLKIDVKGQPPSRWVRYITQANSYVVRV